MSEKMTEKEMINYIDVVEEQNGRVIKEKEELIKQLKAKTLSPETIEVIREQINHSVWYYENHSQFDDDLGIDLHEGKLTQFKQAQQEFTAVYGGGE